MGKVCEVSGTGGMAGHRVSHANNKTKRRFLPNLHKKRFWLPSEKKRITLTISNRGLRTIDKLGIEQVVSNMRAQGKKI